MIKEIRPYRRIFKGRWEGVDLLNQKSIDRTLDRLENFFPKRVVDVLKGFEKLAVYRVKIRRVVTYHIEPLDPYEKFDYSDDSWARVVPDEGLEFMRRMMRSYEESGRHEKAWEVFESIKRNYPKLFTTREEGR